MADTIMYATSPVMIEIIFFAFINSDFPNKNTNYSALFQPFTKRGRVIEMDARPLQTLAVINLLRFVERRV